MIEFHDINQNTDEWMALRIGRIGGSSIGAIMANFGKSFGNPAKVLASNIALEQLTGVKIKSEFNNSHMERGHEKEPIARATYEAENGFITVSNGGYFSGSGIGVSPDGLVGKYGAIEIKDHLPHIHYDNIKRGCFNPSYKWQYFFNLKVTGRRWIDTISHCDQYPINRQNCVYRIESKDCKDKFKQIDERLKEFFQLVEECKLLILG